MMIKRESETMELARKGNDPICNFTGQTVGFFFCQVD